MNEIIIAENKTLKLNNVLYRRLESLDEMGVQRAARMFESYIKSNNLKPYGPMITRTETRMMGRETIAGSQMLAQLREPPMKVEDPYGFEPLIRKENCLMARYTGPFNMMQMAFGKMQVHAFENGITLGGTTFVVFTDSANGIITADIFTETV